MDRNRTPPGRRGLGALVFACLLAALATGRPILAQGHGRDLDEPGKGKFLVANRELLDPNFAQTVVLLVDYSSEGAVGVIVNRPTATPLFEILPDLEDLQDRSETVWLGGPVAHWQMVLLIRSGSQLEGSGKVLDEVYFSASRVVLERLLESDTEFRVYVGYAGWAPGQLDQEIARGGWRVVPGDPEMVFDKAPLELWKELIRRSDVQWVALGR